MNNLAVAISLAAMAGCGGGSGGGSAGAPVSVGPPVTSEADGFLGAGIRVGVISTGVVHLASYQAAGVLPASLYVCQNTLGTLDEGSWMLELVHQHAPDAVLGFCDGIDLDFNGCIKDLGSNFHADIIVDDILYNDRLDPARRCNGDGAGLWGRRRRRQTIRRTVRRTVP